jgi:hypothetical protein
MYLIALIDDATSTLFARFVPADSTGHHMRVLWAYIESYGRPQAVYTDKASLFQPTLAPGWKEEEPGPKTETQLGRAFRELGIEWIAAHSPQAKGRIERCFGTLQDRLVKGLRKAGATTMDEANQYLEAAFLPEWNCRFVVRAGSAVNAHRPVGEALCLESILSHMDTQGNERLHDRVGRKALADSERADTAGIARVDDPNRGAAERKTDGPHRRGILSAECMREGRQDVGTGSGGGGTAIRVSAWHESLDGWLQRAQLESEFGHAFAVGDFRRSRRTRNKPAAARSLIPLSRFPKGKAGAGGFPPRRIKRGSPHKRAAAPL